jgi:hypothetical protein
MIARVTPLLVLLILGAASREVAEPFDGVPPVGIVDFYGLRQVPLDAARAAVRLSPGDRLPADDTALEAALDAARGRLQSVPGVVQAHVELVCCEDGKSILYVGVAETASRGERRAAPRGKGRLPDGVAASLRAVDEARSAAILRGDVEEDDAAGHALLRDPATRALQEKLVGIADGKRDRLRAVLRDASHPAERAMAVEVLAYASDKTPVVADLVDAASDPDAVVRNNALRALGVMAANPALRPEVASRVPRALVVELLGSIEWKDRNKTSLLLLRLTESRDPVFLAAAREAVPELVEMARWKSPGHALPGFTILGRIAGWTEAAIGAAWESGDRESVIRAAERSAPGR